MALSEQLAAIGIPDRIAARAGREIGRGSEGLVLELPGERVLKVNFKAPATQSIRRLAKRVRGRAWAAKMFEHGKLRGQRQGFWYVAERLYPLPAALVNRLNDIGRLRLARRDGTITKERFEALVESILSSLPPDLAAVLRKARRAGYHDLHGKNVMLTASRKYKVIDVESLRPGY